MFDTFNNRLAVFIVDGKRAFIMLYVFAVKAESDSLFLLSEDGLVASIAINYLVFFVHRVLRLILFMVYDVIPLVKGFENCVHLGTFRFSPRTAGPNPYP